MTEEDSGGVGEVYPVGRTRRVKRFKPNKLTEEQVIEIIRALGQGEVGAKLGRKYGVTRATISAIRHGHTWRHLNDLREKELYRDAE